MCHTTFELLGYVEEIVDYRVANENINVKEKVASAL